VQFAGRGRPGWSHRRRLAIALFVISWCLYHVTAGLSVRLDNIKLKLAPADNNAPFVATTEKSAAAGLYTQIFVLGFRGRMLAVPLLARLIEPGARRVRDVI
jgi:hypothetical protein